MQQDQCDFAAFGSMLLGKFTTELPPLSSTEGSLPKRYSLLPSRLKRHNAFLVETSVLKDSLSLLSPTARSHLDSTYLEAIERMLVLPTDAATKNRYVLLSGKWTQFADNLEKKKKQRCMKIKYSIRDKEASKISGIWVHASEDSEPSSHMETINLLF